MSEVNKENKEFTFENEQYRKTYWHTCSHILAQAVKRGQVETAVEKMMILYDGALISSALQGSPAPIHFALEMAHHVLRQHAPRQRSLAA